MFLVFSFLNIVELIKLRFNNKNEKDEIVESRKLTVNEANKIMFYSDIDEPSYHNPDIDEALNVKYDAIFEKDKYGRRTLKTKTRTGNFYYLGSLIASILLTIMVVSTIVDIFYFISNKDYLNIFGFLIFLPILIYFDYKMIIDLVLEVREKIRVKKLIKEGEIEQEKLNFGGWLFRIGIVDFFILFGLFFIGGINQALGFLLPNGSKYNYISFYNFYF